MASGQWDQKVLTFIRGLKRVEDLQALVTNNELLKALPIEVLFTLVGLKLLQNEFHANKNEWSMVAAKALSFIRQRLGGQLPCKISEMIEKLPLNFYTE
jgi:hypothetical protein